MHESDQVDLEHRVDLLGVLLLEQPAGHQAGVVDEQVHRGERRARPLDRLRGQVDLHRPDLAGAAGRRSSALKRAGSRTPQSRRSSGRAASSAAIARPIPRLAPVTSAVIPLRIIGDPGPCRRPPRPRSGSPRPRRAPAEGLPRTGPARSERAAGGVVGDYGLRAQPLDQRPRDAGVDGGDQADPERGQARGQERHRDLRAAPLAEHARHHVEHVAVAEHVGTADLKLAPGRGLDLRRLER